MGLLDRLFKRKQEEKFEEKNEVVVPKIEERKYVELNTGNVTKLYPDGLPLTVLEYIDYSKFGVMLKQEQLLPPSYEAKPIKVELDNNYGKPRVVLTFKSKTSDSERLVGITGYIVSYERKINQPIRIMEVNPLMIAVWRRFAEHVMWKWERGYRFELFDQVRKGEIGKSLMQEDKEYIEHLKRMGEEYMKVIEEQHKDF